MTKVTFKNVEHKLKLVKMFKDILDLELATAKGAVDLGVIDFPDDKYNNIVGAIQSCGGVIIDVNALPMQISKTLAPDDADPIEALARVLNLRKNEDNRVNETRVVSNVAKELVIVSSISISERLYQMLMTTKASELKELQKHIRLIVGFNLIPASDKSKIDPISQLAIRVPEKHNTTEEIVTLSEIVTNIHETVLEAACKTMVFDNIEKDLKPFYDD